VGDVPDPAPEPVEHRPGETIGQATVVYAGPVEQFVDVAVSAGEDYRYAVYAVGEGFVASSPREAAFTLEPPSFAAAAVSPPTASARTELEIDFTLARQVKLSPGTPRVTVAGRAARLELAALPSYHFVYDVVGDEPEGPAQVEITVADYTGEVTRALPITLDFTPPVLQSWQVEGGPFHAGDDVTLEITANEPVGSLLAFVVGAPMACAGSPDGKQWLCRYVVTGTEPKGAQGVSLAFTDLAGNGATAFVSGAFAVQ
jgi:hypothetical protein